MKTIIIGDIHGRTIWREIIEKEKPDKVIFIGDYFDTKEEISGAMQQYNFKEICNYARTSGIETHLIIGNHDFAYWPGYVDYQSTGFQIGAHPEITRLIEENKDILKMAYQFDNILYTHAGLSIVWVDHILGEGWKLEEYGNYADLINEIFKYKPLAFQFASIDYYYTDKYGNNTWQSPIWIRPKALMLGAKEFKKKIIQVVGHTFQNQIDIKGKATGGRYYFIDTLGTSGEYLIINDGRFTTGIS